MNRRVQELELLRKAKTELVAINNLQGKIDTIQRDIQALEDKKRKVDDGPKKYNEKTEECLRNQFDYEHIGSIIQRNRKIAIVLSLINVVIFVVSCFYFYSQRAMLLNAMNGAFGKGIVIWFALVHALVGIVCAIIPFADKGD